MAFDYHNEEIRLNWMIPVCKGKLEKIDRGKICNGVIETIALVALVLNPFQPDYAVIIQPKGII